MRSKLKLALVTLALLAGLAGHALSDPLVRAKLEAVFGRARALVLPGPSTPRADR